MYASLNSPHLKSATKKLALFCSASVCVVALIACGGEIGAPPEVVVTDDAKSATEPTGAAGVPLEVSPYWSHIDADAAMAQYPPKNDRTDYRLVNTQQWLNGEETTIADIRERGEVVLIDFWTYT